MENPVIILGAGHLGRAAREIFEGNGVVVYGFLDDDKKLTGKEIDDIVVLGPTIDDTYLKLVGKKCEVFVAIDDNKVRRNLVEMILEERKSQPVNALHRSAVISPKAELGHGNFVDTHVSIAVGSKIGSHCIIQATSVIGVESVVGNFVQIGCGSLINNGVIVEDDVFIGSGVTVVSGVRLGKGSRVGAGSVVIADVKAGDTVFGNPAHVVKS